VFVLGGLIPVLLGGQLVNLWLLARFSDTPIGFFELVGMRLRKVDLRAVVLGAIRARKAGLDIRPGQLETHFLAGGRVPAVVSAAIAAKGAGVEVGFLALAALDLAGKDPLRVVQAVAAARDGGWPLSVNDAAKVAHSGQDPVEFVERELARHEGATA
jgi:uncharacterized protein YqfA (UPF0365 family)